MLRFGVLGPLAVWAGDGRAAGLPELKVRTLLADLLVHAGRPVPASRLIDDLWGEELPANPTNTLQTRVSQLRRALAGAGGGRELVVCRSAGYSLAVEPEAVDAGEFRALLTRARAAADPGTRAAVLAEALDRWRGPAYADFADHPFARAEIERLTEERLAALEERATARLELGEHGALVAELAALVVEHPLRQRLHAAYLRALYGAGRHNEALAEYAGLRDRLAELGLDPDPELAALQQSILRQDPRLAPRPEVRTNLPAALTSLLGRRDAVRQVRQRVAAGRLVTLTGPGGVGKTRLAVEVARQEADGYRDGAWLVELAAVEAGEDATGVAERLVRTVCTVLGLDAGALAAADLEELVEQSGRVPASRPGGREVRLRDREMLLVLDNCEHVIAPAAALAALLLRAAPGLRVLATSREPLEVPGELRWDVPPLELPGPAEADPAALSKSSAVRLFVDRAAGADPAFQLGTGNAHAVTRICRRLDGIPLALELAATRVRGLGVHEVARRLDDRFRLLSAGLRGAPARQQTLRAVIDWSWSLLSGGERVVLRRLSLHADACTLPAAEVICAGDGVDAADLPDLLARLVDRSLLTRIDGPGGARFRLLESIGAYSLERLHESGEHERVLRRHIAYYTGLSTHAEPRLYGHHPLFSYLLERPGPARPRPRPPAPNGSVLSADGTVIGYDCYGEGRPALVLVGGALNDRMTFAPLARALADRFTVFSYDRRGRGASGDTSPYTVEKEIADLAAVVAEAGGSAYAFGVSSGAVLAAEAAWRGAGIDALALAEPPFILDDTRTPMPADFAPRLDELVAAGRRGDAVELFLTEAVEMPAEVVAPMRGAPEWVLFEQIAHTIAYDIAVMGDFRLPERWRELAVPALVMDGSDSAAWRRNTARTVARVLPRGAYLTLDGHPHDAPPEVLVPVLTELFSGTGSGTGGPRAAGRPP